MFQDTEGLIHHYKKVRYSSTTLCSLLTSEDCNMQSMTDASPPKWNLGHTTWFFETFLLRPFYPSYKSPDETFAYCFNSYYEGAGERMVRPARHLLSRPTLDEVLYFRENTDALMIDLLEKVHGGELEQHRQEILNRTALGIHHEEQHIELFFTDLKHILFSNPYQIAYIIKDLPRGNHPDPVRMIEYEGELTHIGFEGEGFSYDNERGRHRVYINPFAMADRPVSNGEYLDFLESGGYSDYRWWLSDAWFLLQNTGWKHPLYWKKEGSRWYEFTLHGWIQLDPARPVVHVSFFEADAYAKWKGERLPTEFEWEYVASAQIEERNTSHFFDHSMDVSPEANTLHPHPIPANSSTSPSGLFGSVWEWTSSSYLAYPGFRPLEGVAGEYNGKFMNDQRVLRGGSLATPRGHIRPTYRNFFQSDKRWQFSGFRTAKDLTP